MVVTSNRTIFRISVNPQPGTSLSTVWAYVGPLVGVCLGGTIGWLAQRAQWVKNNKKQEFRELLTTLLKAHNAAQLTYSNGAAHWAPGVLQSYTDAIYAAGVVLEDRLFIRKELEKLELKNRWERAMGHLRSTHNHPTFENEFEKIKNDILKAARG
jgi:hypothetical protein